EDARLARRRFAALRRWGARRRRATSGGCVARDLLRFEIDGCARCVAGRLAEPARDGAEDAARRFAPDLSGCGRWRRLRGGRAFPEAAFELAAHFALELFAFA